MREAAKIREVCKRQRCRTAYFAGIAISFLAIIAFVVFRYLQIESTNASIVGILKSVAVDLASYDSSTGSLPTGTEGEGGDNWKSRIQHGVTPRRAREYAGFRNCLGGIFDDKRQWICASHAARQADAALLVFWAECQSNKPMGDIIVSSGQCYVVAQNGTRSNVDLRGCSLCRWSGRIEVIPEFEDSQELVGFLKGVAGRPH